MGPVAALQRPCQTTSARPTAKRWSRHTKRITKSCIALPSRACGAWALRAHRTQTVQRGSALPPHKTCLIRTDKTSNTGPRRIQGSDQAPGGALATLGPEASSGHTPRTTKRPQKSTPDGHQRAGGPHALRCSSSDWQWATGRPRLTFPSVGGGGGGGMTAWAPPPDRPPPACIRKLFLRTSMKFVKPKLEVNFRYTNVLLASDPPLPRSRSPLSRGLVTGQRLRLLSGHNPPLSAAAMNAARRGGCGCHDSISDPPPPPSGLAQQRPCNAPP